jgi:hypothetical protein
MGEKPYVNQSYGRFTTRTLRTWKIMEEELIANKKV